MSDVIGAALVQDGEWTLYHNGGSGVYPTLRLDVIRPNGSANLMQGVSLWALGAYGEYDVDGPYVYYVPAKWTVPVVKGDYVGFFIDLPDARVQDYADQYQNYERALARAQSRLRFVQVHIPSGARTVEKVEMSDYSAGLAQWNATANEANGEYREAYYPLAGLTYGTDSNAYALLLSARQSETYWNAEDEQFTTATFRGVGSIYVNEINGGAGRYITFPPSFYNTRFSPGVRMFQSDLHASISNTSTSGGV